MAKEQPSNACELSFPRLIRIGLLGIIEPLFFALLLGIGGVFVSRFSKVLGLLMIAPLALLGTPFLLYQLVVVALNAFRRYRWAFNASKRIAPWRISNYVKSNPNNFELHVRFYSGFDQIRLAPAAYLKNLLNNDCFAVYPSSHRIVRIGERAQVPVYVDGKMLSEILAEFRKNFKKPVSNRAQV